MHGDGVLASLYTPSCGVAHDALHYCNNNMNTISITIDEGLLKRIDRAAKTAHRTRSETFRIALEEWLATRKRRQLAAEERAAYAAHPVTADEFEGLIAAQALTTADAADNDGDEW